MAISCQIHWHESIFRQQEMSSGEKKRVTCSRQSSRCGCPKVHNRGLVQDDLSPADDGSRLLKEESCTREPATPLPHATLTPPHSPCQVCHLQPQCTGALEFCVDAWPASGDSRRRRRLGWLAPLGRPSVRTTRSASAIRPAARRPALETAFRLGQLLLHGAPMGKMKMSHDRSGRPESTGPRACCSAGRGEGATDDCQ